MKTAKTKLFQEKHIELIQLLIRHGEVDVQEAANEIGVSKATIYNYYNYLNGLVLERVKGKLRIRIDEEKPDSVDENEPFTARLSKNEVHKYKVAQKITTEIIKESDIIFLDCGSSNYIIAEQIVENQIEDLKVVTNNPFVFEKLRKYRRIKELSVIGGIYSGSHGSFYGNWADNTLDCIKKNDRFMKCFIGADGCSLQDKHSYISLINSIEKEQKLLIMSVSDKIYFPLDQSKIGRAGTILTHSDEDYWSKICVLIGCDNDENIKKGELIGKFGSAEIVVVT